MVRCAKDLAIRVLAFTGVVVPCKPTSSRPNPENRRAILSLELKKPLKRAPSPKPLNPQELQG